MISLACTSLLWAIPQVRYDPPQPIPITLEHAVDTQKKTWGLMQRDALPNDWGMLFHSDHPKRHQIWSFNCLLDLDVAFLDSDGVIQEISFLKAYPEMMDPKRPVNMISDLSLYSSDDPILKFYWKNSIISQQTTSKILECKSNYFKNNNLHIGDILIFDPQSDQGLFLHPIQLKQMLNGTTSLKINLSNPSPIAMNNREGYMVELFDTNGSNLQATQKGNIVYCLSPVATATISSNSPPKQICLNPKT